MDTLQKQFLKQLGQKIKSIRTKQGLSQSEVANLCGKERQSYQRVETGNINVSIWYLQHIATALNIDIKEFFDFDFTKPNI